MADDSTKSAATHAEAPAPRAESWLDALSAAVRANLVPGLVLQAVALALVLSYYFLPAARPAWERLREIKAAGGILYSACATSFFGGAIPLLWLALAGKLPRVRRAAFVLSNLGFWALQGVVVDRLYYFQAQWFGDAPTVASIVPKVAVDQFVFNPVWAVPAQVLFRRWVDSGCVWSDFTAGLNRGVVTRAMPTVLFSTWVVWIPAVAIIYALPEGLQVPLNNLVLLFWVLLLALLARSGTEQAKPSNG